VPLPLPLPLPLSLPLPLEAAALSFGFRPCRTLNKAGSCVLGSHPQRSGAGEDVHRNHCRALTVPQSLQQR